MTEEEKTSFFRYALQKVYFYIESNFWSKPSYDSLNKWLNNFKTVDEKYCAAKLLDRFVYYSEEDILRMLEFGLNEIIFKRKMLSEEINSSFNVTNSDLITLKRNFFQSTIILPLISNDNPSESSLALSRYITNDLGFSEDKILHIKNLTDKVLSETKNIIILDDFIGTGKQILDFWNHTQISIDGKLVSVNKLKLLYPKLDIEYLCLVCTEEGYNNFHSENMSVGLRITYCEKLTNKFKVFGSESVYFEKEEVEYYREVIEKLCEKCGIDVLGYQGLDYALAFHHSTPDATLPLFFTKGNKWQPLFTNKKTQQDVLI